MNKLLLTSMALAVLLCSTARADDAPATTDATSHDTAPAHRVNNEYNRAMMLASLGRTNPAIDPHFWVNVGGISQGLTGGNNKAQNLGLGAEFHLSADSAILAGRANNTASTRSNYAGLMFTPMQLGRVKYGVIAEAQNGYTQRRNGKYFATLAPVVTFEMQHAGVNLTLTPNASGRANSALAVQFKWQVY